MRFIRYDFPEIDSSILKIPGVHLAITKEELVKKVIVCVPGPDSIIYLIDDKPAKLIKLSDEGKFIGIINGPGSGPGEYLDLHWIVNSARNNVFLADIGNNRIQILDKNGKFIRQITNFPFEGYSSEKFAVDANEHIIYRSRQADKYLISVYDNEKEIKNIGDLAKYGKNLLHHLAYNSIIPVVDTTNKIIWCVFETLPFFDYAPLIPDSNLLISSPFFGTCEINKKHWYNRKIIKYIFTDIPEKLSEVEFPWRSFYKNNYLYCWFWYYPIIIKSKNPCVYTKSE